MKVNFNKDHKLEFDLTDLLDSVNAESKVSLIDDLSCDEAVLKHVVDQILSGWTEEMNCGCSDYPEHSVPRYSLSFARREISKKAGELAKETIEKLEKALSTAEKRIQDLEELERNAWCARRKEY